MATKKAAKVEPGMHLEATLSAQTGSYTINGLRLIANQPQRISLEQAEILKNSDLVTIYEVPDELPAEDPSESAE